MSGDVAIFFTANQVPKRLTDFDTTGWGAAQAGRIWFNVTDKKYKFWDGSTLQVLPSISGGTSYELPDSYGVFKDGTPWKAQNGHTGHIDFSDANPIIVINNALAGLTAGRTSIEKVVIKGDV